ncbi:MAG: FCD domain-containing protein [Beijerinckiaceae bacterium]|nr:FCD domain-containing protein [Beijerinckiaceae bacterium]
MSQTSFIARAPRLGEDLASTLREAILKDGLKEGDRLPTEKALAEQYGVSRTVVREAIARLQTEGVVAARQGSGVFVNRRNGHNVFRIHDNRVRHTQLQNCYELRLGVEAAAAELAAQRRTSDDIAALEALIVRMADPALRVAADTEFHVAIARATKNELYESFVGFIGAELSSVIGDAVVNTITRHPDQVDQVIAEHGLVLKAIAAGDAAGAREAMAGHITAAATRLSIGLRDASPSAGAPSLQAKETH